MDDNTRIHNMVMGNLNAACDTFNDRNRAYGDTFMRIGPIMQGLFPSGISISSPDQWNRITLLMNLAGKLARYVANPHLGHGDSIHDAINYAAMLEAVDAAIAGGLSIQDAVSVPEALFGADSPLSFDEGDREPWVHDACPDCAEHPKNTQALAWRTKQGDIGMLRYYCIHGFETKESRHTGSGPQTVSKHTPQPTHVC